MDNAQNGYSSVDNTGKIKKKTNPKLSSMLKWVVMENIKFRNSVVHALDDLEHLEN